MLPFVPPIPMENSTFTPNDGVTAIYLEEKEPRLIWLPHVLLAAIMLGLLAISFIHFHLKYKDRYISRSHLARHESIKSIHCGDEMPHHLKAIVEKTYYTDEKKSTSPMANGSKATNEDSNTSRGKTKKGKRSNSGIHGVFCSTSSEEDNAKKTTPDVTPPMNITPYQLEVIPSLVAKLNDRQCLTFQKRDSRQNVFASGSHENRWVPMRQEGWKLTKSPSKSHITTQSNRTSKLSSQEHREARPFAVNLWSSGARRNRNKETSKTSSSRNGRSVIFHL